MKYVQIADLKASQLALGAMRIAGESVSEVEELISVARECGINFFDHADIYGGGKSESVFGEVLKKHPAWRSDMIIQSKCGIVPGVCYNFDKEYIIAAVNGILSRLHTDYLDILLLHRPDILGDPEEVSSAFEELHTSGKVRYFGVSNMSAMQLELYRQVVKQPLLINQLQFNVVNSQMIDQQIYANMNEGIDHDGGILAYCMLHHITIQPWSILQASWSEGSFLDHPNYGALNSELDRLSEKYHISKAAVSLAWILRHPAHMQPVAGTTSPLHLKELVRAFDITMSREDYYKLYLAGGKTLP